MFNLLEFCVDLLKKCEFVMTACVLMFMLTWQVVVRNLLETLRLVYQNKDDVASVINVFCSICEDYDFSVRTELMVQLPHLVAFCKEVKLNNFLVQYLVPTLITYLGDDSNTVRKTAHSALVTLLEQGLLEKEIVTEKVCPLVLHLTDKMHPRRSTNRIYSVDE
ncbi:hypothetical protein CEXT_368971 [Caerostris extrusa]|uniref:Uncharacterized protein n=1 Tax=Caerostris extrusa TaxID=172846 RepID=A0AAV4MLM2_CAEEX|nr:hypothetical protein CEXT_368971 [Caerostris extrusa]